MNGVRAADRVAPAFVAIAIFAAATTMRPQIVAVGPLTPRMSTDLDVSFGAMGLITTASIVLMGLAAPLGPRLLGWLGFRASMVACMMALLVASIIRAAAPDYVLVLALSATIGVVVGVGQSIVPALGREWSLVPRLASGSFTMGVVGSAVVAAAVAVPLAAWTGSWRTALIALALPVAASLLVWLWIVPKRGAAGRQVDGSIPLPLRDREALWLAVCFGLQGVLYHSLVAWLPEIAVETGASEVRGGTLVALLNLSALAATLVILVVGGRLGPASKQVVAASAVACLGALALAAGAWFEIIAIVVGSSLGAILPLLVTLGLARSRDPARASSLIAFVFLVGYVMAGLAPMLVGLARDISGDFSSGLWLLALDGGLLLAVAIRVRRPDRRQERTNP